jgi:hypothetical protein
MTAPPDDPAKEFWIESRNLTQEQLRLLDRMEQALTQAPDAQRFKVLKGQVFLHLTELDRFLKLGHAEPGQFCGIADNGQLPGTDAIDPEQVKVFCTLYRTRQDVSTVRTYFDRQVKPTASAQSLRNNTLTAIRTSRQRLMQTQAAFPVAFRPDFPIVTSDAGRFAGFSNEEWQPHTAFLAQPNTGIARIVAGEVVVAANQQSVAAPFPVVAQRTVGLSPRLPMRISGNLFQLMPMGLDYGFVASLGDVPLETLTMPLPEQAQALPKLLGLFYTYQPPTQYSAIQADRRRFLSGNATAFGLTQPISNYIAAHPNRTYLVRSIQYKLPESGTRRLESSDVLVAFRTVNQRSDGSYTVLWRVLNQFPDPQVRDLSSLSQVQSKRR